MLRIGIDVGGTFTDLVAVDEEGERDARQGRLDAGRPVARRHGRARAPGGGAGHRAGARCSAQTERIVHGTTVATNALLERKGARVGLLTTEGHRDVLEMREGLKDDRYDLRQPPPEPLVPRELRLACASACAPTAASRPRSTSARSTTAIAALRAGRRRGGRGLLPARLARRPARAADRRGAARGAARGARLALLRGAAADQGVRAGLHHGRQRLCRPGAGALSRPARRRGCARRAMPARS